MRSTSERSWVGAGFMRNSKRSVANGLQKERNSTNSVLARQDELRDVDAEDAAAARARDLDPASAELDRVPDPRDAAEPCEDEPAHRVHLVVEVLVDIGGGLELRDRHRRVEEEAPVGERLHARRL